MMEINDQLAEMHAKKILHSMQDLCKLFDSGSRNISYLIAVEINKLLTEITYLVRLRGSLKFISPDVFEEPGNMLSFNRLIIGAIHVDSAEFVPHFSAPNAPHKYLIFRDWWNREVIFRAGSTFKKCNNTNQFIELPFHKREKFTRREFIQYVRNTLGAHLDKYQNNLLTILHTSKSFGMDLRIQTESGYLSADEGTLPILTYSIDAMIRQIAHEILDTYRTYLNC